MDTPTVELIFARGDEGADSLQAVVDDVLAELSDPSSEAARAATDAGSDLEDLSDASVHVCEGAQGADPFLTPIVVGIAVTAGSRIAETLWTDVLWPRLRRRLGVTALGQQKSRTTPVEHP